MNGEPPRLLMSFRTSCEHRHSYRLLRARSTNDPVSSALWSTFAIEIGGSARARAAHRSLDHKRIDCARSGGQRGEARERDGRCAERPVDPVAHPDTTHERSEVGTHAARRMLVLTSRMRAISAPRSWFPRIRRPPALYSGFPPIRTTTILSRCVPWKLCCHRSICSHSLRCYSPGTSDRSGCATLRPPRSMPPPPSSSWKALAGRWFRPTR